MAESKRWRGQTLHARSLDRREQLLDVGEQLLGTGGAAAVTMRAVIRDANLSPRYFYETFASREDLLIAVYDRVEQQLLERMQRAETGAGLRAGIRNVFLQCGDFFDEDPRRARVLLREPQADDTLRNHSISRVPTFIRLMIPFLGADAGRLAPARDEDLAVRAAALSGALVSLYLEYADGRLEIEREDLADFAADVVFALAGIA
jgi:AcrR family transcriptional regulator